jgi:hypothetical protein
MKKLLVGCLVIIVLGVIVVGVGSYFLYRAASPLLEDARSYLQGMSQLEEIERGITNTSTYAAPSSGELNDAQVQRFVRVQQHVRSQLGQRMTEIEQKYKTLRDETTADRTGPASLIEMMNALRDMAGAYVDARRYQVEALNKEGFSQEEYAWVRDRMFQAAGMEIGSRIDIEKLQEAIKSGTGFEGITADRIPKPDVPARNRELVKPYVAQMDEWLPLVFFGL